MSTYTYIYIHVVNISTQRCQNNEMKTRKKMNYADSTHTQEIHTVLHKADTVHFTPSLSLTHTRVLLCVAPLGGETSGARVSSTLPSFREGRLGVYSMCIASSTLSAAGSPGVRPSDGDPPIMHRAVQSPPHRLLE